MSGTASAFAQDWRTLSPTEYGFSIEFPGTALPAKIGIDREAMVTGQQWVLVKGETTYVVVAVEFKIAVAEKAGFLDAVVNRTKGQCGAISDNKRSTLPGGAVAADVTVTQCPDGKALRGRIAASGPWLYQVIVVGGPDVESQADTQHFINSFKITGASPTAPGAAPR
ncbi:MAG TPA: hypothetical protein VFB45_10800 [Pseudolabrys sp.]|nr:hypothetical protein [Pseudolabrys sp.]